MSRAPDEGQPSAPSGRAAIRLVASREITERLRTKSFYILTGLLVAIILVVGLAVRLLGSDDDPSLEVGVSGPVPAALSDTLVATGSLYDLEVELTEFADEPSAMSALEEGDVDLVLLGDDLEVVFASTVDDQAFQAVQQAWASAEIAHALADAGVDPAELATALDTTSLEATTLEGGATTSVLALLIGMMAAFLLFLSLQTFGGYVLTGVVEEKSTAVIEVLLARASPDQMLAGKVLGIGVAAMLQFALAVAAAVTALVLSGVEVPGEIWAAVPMTLVWFLGGYALYSMLFAVAGSLVSRQEDAQAASTPIYAALIGAYVLVFTLGSEPESTASVVLSLIPPFAPLLMPMRMAAGAATPVEVVASLVLLAVAILLAWKVTGRIYEQVLLRRGSRISWKDAVGLLRRS